MDTIVRHDLAAGTALSANGCKAEACSADLVETNMGKMQLLEVPTTASKVRPLSANADLVKCPPIQLSFCRLANKSWTWSFRCYVLLLSLRDHENLQCYRDFAMSCSGSCSQKTKALVSMLCRATASKGVEGSVKPVCGVKRARPSRES